MKIAVTFGVQYNDVTIAHPFDKRITGQHYMVFEGKDFKHALARANLCLASRETGTPIYAFSYPFDEDFTGRQIPVYSLEEFVPDEKTWRANADRKQFYDRKDD